MTERQSERRGNGADTAPEWSQPINLFRGLAAPALVKEDVPRIVGEYAEAFAMAGGFDITGAIIAGVAACATAVDDGIRLLLPGASGHFQSARVWIAAVGSPGAGKSPMQRQMLAPIYELHRDLVEQTERQRQALPDDERGRVPPRALFTSDCTIDKLSEILADNPRGILYGVDELDSWLGQHEAFGRESGARNRGEWMRLYDGGPHQVDRVRRGSFFVKNWGASVLTATTPAALARLARKLSADGLFQRFMVFAVKSMCNRDHALPSIIVERHRRDYAERMAAVLAHRADLVEHPIVRLSGPAASLYEAEEGRLRQLVEAAENVGDGFAAHVAKHVGMLARVALTFHAFGDDLLTDDGLPRHPCAGNVSEATMRLAIRFMRRAYQHAYAVYTECLGIGTPMELAKAMARSILADELDDFNRREMTFSCRAFRSAAEWQRLAALRALEDCDWIQGEALLPEHGGRWRVNPHVHALYRAERDRARERRRTAAYAMHGIEEVAK